MVGQETMNRIEVSTPISDDRKATLLTAAEDDRLRLVAVAHFSTAFSSLYFSGKH